MDEVTEEMLGEMYRARPSALLRDNFFRRWIEANCAVDDLRLMQSVRAWLWGPGTSMKASDYVERELGRTPTDGEVEAVIDRELRVMASCQEAWEQSDEHRVLQRIRYGREL